MSIKLFKTLVSMVLGFNSSLLLAQEITASYSPGLYTPQVGQRFQGFGNKVTLGYSRVGHVNSSQLTIDGTENLFSFQNLGLSYLTTTVGEDAYAAVSLPITLGLGYSINYEEKETKAVTVGALGSFEAIYPLTKFTNDPVHGNISLGGFLRLPVTEKLSLNLSARYAIFIGQSSLKNFVSSDVWIGYKLFN